MSRLNVALEKLTPKEVIDAALQASLVEDKHGKLVGDGKPFVSEQEAQLILQSVSAAQEIQEGDLSALQRSMQAEEMSAQARTLLRSAAASAEAKALATKIDRLILHMTVDGRGNFSTPKDKELEEVLLHIDDLLAHPHSTPEQRVLALTQRGAMLAAIASFDNVERAVYNGDTGVRVLDGSPSKDAYRRQAYADIAAALWLMETHNLSPKGDPTRSWRQPLVLILETAVADFLPSHPELQKLLARESRDTLNKDRFGKAFVALAQELLRMRNSNDLGVRTQAKQLLQDLAGAERVMTRALGLSVCLDEVTWAKLGQAQRPDATGSEMSWPFSRTLPLGAGVSVTFRF